MFTNADEVLRFISDEDVKFVDVRFCDLPGVMQHFNVPAQSLDADFFTGGAMFDGSSIRGFQAIHESDMKLIPDVTTAYVDPFRTEKTLNINFSIRRPVHRRAVQPRPAQRGRQGRGVPGQHRHRRHRVLRPRGRVLRLRRRAVRDQGERRLLLHRLHRGRLEQRPRRGGRQPRLQDPVQGRLLPRPAAGPLRRPARPDEPGARRRRHPGRARAPRGRHRRPGRDQLQVRHAAQGRRPADGVQVRRQERRVVGGQDRDVHAQAALRRQRVGDALPPVAVEGRRSAVLRRARLRRAVRHRALVHRRPARARAVAAGLHQPDRELLPPPRARVRGAGQPGVLASATARPASASRSPGRTRRPSGSSSACPTRPRTRTWRSRPC